MKCRHTKNLLEFSNWSDWMNLNIDIQVNIGSYVIFFWKLVNILPYVAPYIYLSWTGIGLYFWVPFFSVQFNAKETVNRNQRMSAVRHATARVIKFFTCYLRRALTYREDCNSVSQLLQAISGKEKKYPISLPIEAVNVQLENFLNESV